MFSKNDFFSDDDIEQDLNKDDEDYDFPPLKDEALNLNYSKSTKDSHNFGTKIFSFFKKRKRSSDSSNSSIDEIKSNSLNKSIKDINKKELSSFQKSIIKSQKENFDKQFNLLKTDFNLLVEYEKEIFKDTNLDIMFIMDLTGSMSMWLNEAKKSVSNIIEEITDNNPGSKIRLSFIGYRDFTESNQVRIYDSIEFSDNFKEFNNFLSGLDCYGGGDEPEDVVGALNKALNMKWEANAKYAVLVCDAPCHGNKYHNSLFDKFENGDPNGLILENIMQKFMDAGITFYCIEINNTTKKMFDIMKHIYNDENKFHIEKLGNVNQFSFFVSFSASLLLESTKYSKIKFKDFLSNYRKESINKILSKYSHKLKNEQNNVNIENNSNLETFSIINQIENLDLEGNDKKLFDFINRMNELEINNIKNEENDFIINKLDETIIHPTQESMITYTLKGLTYNKDLNLINDWISPSIIEQNVDTKILFSYNTLKYNNENSEYEISIYDLTLAKNLIGKIPSKIKKVEYNNSTLLLKNLYMKEVICEQIGDYFNIKIHDEFPQLNKYIKFQKHIIYECNDNNKNQIQDNNNYKYIIGDATIQFDYTLSTPMDKQILNTFSHFSYQISGGQLLISDFKYDKFKRIVTNFNIYFFEENGYKNILEFFSSHICDNNCKKLGLSHPRKKNKNIIVEEDFFSNKYLTNTTLCKCCSIPIIKNDEMSCAVCAIKIVRNKRTGTCISCHFPFEYSVYNYNCQLLNIPKKCKKCEKIF